MNSTFPESWTIFTSCNSTFIESQSVLVWPCFDQGDLSSQTEMCSELETKDIRAVVIGLVFFFQLLKSPGTSLFLPSRSLSLSLWCFLSSASINPSFLCSFFQFPALLRVFAQCKNIFIILLCCPRSAAPQNTNDSVSVRERLPTFAQHTSICVFDYECMCVSCFAWGYKSLIIHHALICYKPINRMHRKMPLDACQPLFCVFAAFLLFLSAPLSVRLCLSSSFFFLTFYSVYSFHIHLALSRWRLKATVEQL